MKNDYSQYRVVNKPWVDAVSGIFRRFLPILLVLLIVVGGLYFAVNKGIIKGIGPTKSVVSNSESIGDFRLTKVDKVGRIPLPSTKPAPVTAGQPQAITWVMKWNSQMAQIGANGGPQTTEGSLMANYGVRLVMENQDDTETAKIDFLKCVKDWHDGKSQKGCFIEIMGDGWAQHAQSLQDNLKKIDPAYQVEVVYSPGRSYGEDRMIGPLEWLNNAQSMRGGVCVGYPRDGDWDLALHYAAQNKIPNNSNEHTYNPGALNWIYAPDFLKAVEIFLAGKEEAPRPIVDDNGRKIPGAGEKRGIRPQCVVTWTPGDEMAFRQMPKDDPRYQTLTTIISTRPGQQSGQMPNVMFGLNKWNEQHSNFVVGMILATDGFSKQMSSYEEALQFAGEASARTYKPGKTGDYWVRYYRGVTFNAPAGRQLLGGSAVHTLADNLDLFGLSPDGTENVRLTNSQYASVYRNFGNIVKEQFPKEVPTFPAVEEVVTTKYLKLAVAQLAASNQQVGGRVIPAVAYGEREVQQQMGQADYSITFGTNSAKISPASEAVLMRIFDQLQSGDYKVFVYGHTDRTGSDVRNQQLSEERAQAVKQWLESRNRRAFPEGRLEAKGFAGNRPPRHVDMNYIGRCDDCRRVEIIQGTVQ